MVKQQDGPVSSQSECYRWWHGGTAGHETSHTSLPRTHNTTEGRPETSLVLAGYLALQRSFLVSVLSDVNVDIPDQPKVRSETHNGCW